MNLVKGSRGQCTPWNKGKSLEQGLERYCNYRFNLLIHGSRTKLQTCLCLYFVSTPSPTTRPMTARQLLFLLAPWRH